MICYDFFFAFESDIIIFWEPFICKERFKKVSKFLICCYTFFNRAVGSFFMVCGGGGAYKYRPQWLANDEKWKKQHWLKRPKAVPQKMKLGPKYRWFKISYLDFSFRKYYFGHTTFTYSSTRSSRHFRYSSKKSQSQNKNWGKRWLISQYSSLKNVTHFMSFNLLDTENKMLPQHSQHPFWLYKYSANMFLFGVRISICTVPFLDAQ